VGAALTDPGGYTDFYYEAMVFVPVDLGTYYGIEFRMDTTGFDTTIASFGYHLVCRFKPGSPPFDPKLRFRHRIGGTPALIQEWDDSTLPGGIPVTSAWHKLGVYCKADSFWLYFNETLLPGCPLVDNTYTGGSFTGFYYWDMMTTDTVMFVDDVLVAENMGAAVIENENTFIPSNLYLSQNYPNPFNPSTTIKYDLKKSETVKLTVYNLAGQAVKTLVNGTVGAGSHTALWDATDKTGNHVSAGVYLYTLQTMNFSETRKMILLK